MGWPSAIPSTAVNLLYLIDGDRSHRIDRTRDMGSIDPDPVYIYKVEQIDAVDWDRRRRFQSIPICSSRLAASGGPVLASPPDRRGGVGGLEQIGVDWNRRRRSQSTA